jgi:UDP-3-O-[3-hydroxymyristoyl] glucosamine N-acyltransferase
MSRWVPCCPVRQPSGSTAFIMKLEEIAELIDGRVIGDGGIDVSGVSGLSEVGDGDITFLSDNKLLQQAKESRAVAVIVKEAIAGLNKPQIEVANPQLAFVQLLSHFYVKPATCMGTSEKAFVSSSAVIGINVTIYPFAYVADGAIIGKDSIIYPGVFIGENSIIGEACIIYSNVTVREGVTIGNGVIIHAGAVIGADGFGYVFDGQEHRKIPQVGGVVLEDNVEIGANTTIDRATTGMTVIGRGTKIDNLVQIGHNVKIGRNTIFVAQVGIGGSSDVGDGVILAGQVGVGDHVSIESGTIAAAQAGLTGKAGRVKKGVYGGTPALPINEAMRAAMIHAKLPELRDRIRELEDKIESLSRQGTGSKQKS